MRLAVGALGSVEEPYLQVHQEHVLAMLLRPGSVEVGSRRSAIRRVTFQAGEIRLCTRHSENRTVTLRNWSILISFNVASYDVGLEGRKQRVRKVHAVFRSHSGTGSAKDGGACRQT